LFIKAEVLQLEANRNGFGATWRLTTFSQRSSITANVSL